MSPQTNATGVTWNGNAMSQNDMMEKDTVLVLDQNDNVIGSESKKGAHIFNTEQPRGILHRAFSAFLFDEKTGDLLLQKRAASKITFPNVSVSVGSALWYLTCSSFLLIFKLLLWQSQSYEYARSLKPKFVQKFHFRYGQIHAVPILYME